jgi:hypothetical protein
LVEVLILVGGIWAASAVFSSIVLAWQVVLHRDTM